jgi:hypothetical protein
MSKKLFSFHNERYNMKINILTLSFGLMVLGVLAAQNPTDKSTNPKSGESIDFKQAHSIFQK